MGTRRSEGYRCTSCATPVAKWVGHCEQCGAWGTISEIGPGQRAGGGPGGGAVRIAEVAEVTRPPLATGSREIDRVTNGGITPASLTLLAGEPGIGKSTLALQLAAESVRQGRRALYISAEEAPSQVRGRAARLGALGGELWLAGERRVEAAVAEIERLRPDLVVVDSIQTVGVDGVGGAPGSVSQVREAALVLAEVARSSEAAVLLVGHVTKDGSLAGPRQLEHLVDTVLSFEGDRHHALRLLRAVKHRFGPTSELGLFEMVGGGLVDVEDPSGLLLADRRAGAPGSVVFPSLDGRRPLLVEIQSLVVSGPGTTPRRSAQGLDSGRLGVLLAVLGRVLELPVLNAEVYCLAAGGVAVKDQGVDLAVACAVVSSMCGRPLPADTVVCGEIGLGGEVRTVAQLDRRLAEVARAGFRRAVVPPTAPDVPGLELVRARTVSEALLATGLAASRPTRTSRPTSGPGPTKIAAG
ncbi:MAG: DNA repair protein RadA [Acidimicrobiales bacterium]